jgi:hypothetical protein
MPKRYTPTSAAADVEAALRLPYEPSTDHYKRVVRKYPRVVCRKGEVQFGSTIFGLIANRSNSEFVFSPKSCMMQ